MPESRTFDPSSSDPIQQALLKALGEPVRPRQPGAPDAAPAKPAAPKPPTVTTIGSFTFAQAPAPAKSSAPTDDPDDLDD